MGSRNIVSEAAEDFQRRLVEMLRRTMFILDSIPRLVRSLTGLGLVSD
jgi:hypothetical protein